MNVLIINGHPRQGSLSDALAEAYRKGAIEGCTAVEQIVLRELDFNPDVTHFSPRQQIIESDLVATREALLWANHVVFVYPTWWGTMPALLKGFIDRVFTDGFAFEEIEGGTGYRPLFRGKTAQLITIMDTPWLVYQLIYRSPGHNAMRRSILEFCGFELSSTLAFGPVKSSSPVQREKWLRKAKMKGYALKDGPLRRQKRITIRAISWLKALRLQFYPMTAIAYALGVWAAVYLGYTFNVSIFWAGYAWIFFLEVTTVLHNEISDYPTDRKNKYFGPFTGGSRVIVDGILNARSVKNAMIFCLFASAAAMVILLLTTKGNLIYITLNSAILAILALGYTGSPLKLAYRTLGEVTVAITHSFSVILSGYLFMGGQLSDPYAWVLSLPLFFAVLPSITLAGIPDYDADLESAKYTIAARFGIKNAARLAMSFTILSVVALVWVIMSGLFPVAFKNLIYFVIPHASWLIFELSRFINNPAPPKRIDLLMIAALSYLVWYAVVPLINLI